MTGVRADRESLKLQQVGFRIALRERVLRRTHRSPSCMSASDSGPAAPTSMSADELVGSVVRPLTVTGIVGAEGDLGSGGGRDSGGERHVTVEWVPLRPQGEARIAVLCED